jgi:hypothetical protein
MHIESKVPGVSLEAMVAMSLQWEGTSDPQAERASYSLPRNAGCLRLRVHLQDDGCELNIDYEDSCAAHAVRNLLRENYGSVRAAKNWAVLRVMALVWIIERSHGNAVDFHSEAPAGL